MLQKPVLSCAGVPGPDSNRDSENAKASQAPKDVLDYLDPLILRHHRTTVLTAEQYGQTHRPQVQPAALGQRRPLMILAGDRPLSARSGLPQT